MWRRRLKVVAFTQIARDEQGHRRVGFGKRVLVGMCGVEALNGYEAAENMSGDSGLRQVGERAAFYGRQKNLDTVVFVHGLGGHFSATWDRFPELLATDPDLPQLDILLWGYKTGVLRPLVADMESVGGQLMSELVGRIESDNCVHLVGHSLGGLVILNGIVSEMVDGRAQQPPTRLISFVSLFASPVRGSNVAKMMRLTLGRLWGLGRLVNRQIRSLASGSEVDVLLGEVVERIYAPVVEDSSHRTIPIRMVMGNGDRAVQAADRRRARARYKRNTPLVYDHDHKSIKEPRHHDDARYQALSRDLQDGLADRFRSICVALGSASKDEKLAAAIEFERRYERIFRRRLEDEGVDIDQEPALYASYLWVVIRECGRRECAPYYAADRVLRALLRRQLVGRGR